MKRSGSITAAEYRALLRRPRSPQRKAGKGKARGTIRSRAVAPHAAVSGGPGFVEAVLPIRIESSPNLREHWTVRHKRALAHDEAVTYSLIGSRELRDVIAGGPPYVVSITRIAPTSLDDDNAVAGAKHVRDSIARLLGVDDGDRNRVRWIYPDAEAADYYAVRVRIEGRNGEA